MSCATRMAAREGLRLDAAPSEPSAIPLTLAYSLPPCSPLTDGDARRLVHEDLGDMDTDELTNEAWRLRLVLAFGDLRRPSWARAWLETRLRICRLALKRQGGQP